ncbi:MAG: hypothetical protein COV76_06335 [Candidatus Omnitrophica bacterium CG11_big_fil_rev_8_21_14_0_20_64_10]|nr:MAG: hypothetical protein COV76_06335 [Candidatus Omnitrophica bacterium CG11_big_fil_rev_8_21_14_0_20_64_10]
MRFLKTLFCALASAALLTMGTADAKTVPPEDTQAPYFYVFGPEGDPLLGAQDHMLELFVDVPQSESRMVRIEVYDPDTGGMRDFRTDSANRWNTVTAFSLYGAGGKLIQEARFGADRKWDRSFYAFEAQAPSAGEKVGSVYRFRLEVKTLQGDDANLFRVRTEPASAEAFSYSPTFRLRPEEGEKMFFYPEVPAGTKQISLRNYDLDANGGKGILYNPVDGTHVKVADSLSGQWAETRVAVRGDVPWRLEYIVTKGTQHYAHAGVEVLDDRGNHLPVYFQQGRPMAPTPRPAPAPKPVPAPAPAPKPAPTNACNQFTFDATESYDLDKQPLTFLWDFGDGSTATEPVVSHVFQKGGKYKVSLTVTDSSGLVCNSDASFQWVKVNTPPKAAFTLPELVCVGEELAADAGGTMDDAPENLSYVWNFGDGSTAEGKQVRKQFAKGGTYRVTLKVDDNEKTVCSTDEIARTIRVNTPPTADAGKDQTLCLKSFDDVYAVSFDAGGSRDADGDKLSYAWDFGDGAIGEGQRVSHTYAKGGSYTVGLTVDDGVGSRCSVAKDTLQLRLDKPPVATAKGPAEACAGASVAFDGSGSKAETGKTLAYSWDFGDGATATGARVNHTFAKGGTYRVALTVNDGSGSACATATASMTVKVNGAPSAALTGETLSCVTKPVRFDASGSKDPDGDSLRYTWNFGDGTVEEGSSKASHAYAKGGNYTVKVTVDDRKGSSCSTASATHTVRINTPPVADTGPNLVCCVDQTVTFDGSKSSDADGDRLTYHWDFGDGAAGEGAKVSHAYKEIGQYKVVLTVKDNSGTDCDTSTDSFVADVNAKPVSVIKVR